MAIVCNLSFVTPSCFAANASAPGQPDGTISVVALDGSSAATVKYSLNSDFTYPFGQTSGLFSNILPGTYTVYARNSTSCRAVITMVVGVNSEYAIRYRLPFKDPYNNQYKLEIEDSEYESTVNEVIGEGSNPVRIVHRGESNEDVFYPVISSLIEVNLKSLTDQQYLDFYTFDEKRFRAKVYKWNGSAYELYHVGYLTPMLYSEPYVLKQGYDINLIFTDGLADLKNYEFSDDSGNFPTDRIPMFNAINYIINKTEIALNIWETVNMYATGIDTGTNDSTLEQAYIDPRNYLNSDGTVKTCDQVLAYILEFFGAKLYQANGRWNIDLVSEKTASSVPTRKRTSNYGVLSGGNESPRVLLRRETAVSPKVCFKDQNQVMSIPQTYGTIKLTHNLGIQNNMLPYGEFKEEDIEAGQFKGWQIDDANGGGATFGIEKIERNGEQSDALFIDFSACDIADNYVLVQSLPIFYDYPGSWSYQWVRVSFDIYTRPLFTKAEVFFDYAITLGDLFVGPRVYPSGSSDWNAGKRIISDQTGDLIDGRYNRLFINESLSWKTITVEFPLAWLPLEGVDDDLQIEFRAHSNPIYDHASITDLKAEVIDANTAAGAVYWSKTRRVKDTYLTKDVIRVYELEFNTLAESLPDIVRPNSYTEASPYNRAYIWRLKQVVEITAVDKNWLQSILIDKVKIEYFPDGEPPVGEITVTETPNAGVRQTLAKEIFHGDLSVKNKSSIDPVNYEYLIDNNYKHIQKSYLTLEDGTAINGNWKRRGVTENYTSIELLAKMYRGQYQERRWKLTGNLICPDGMISFWNTIHEVRTGKIYQLISLVQNLKSADAEIEAIETLSGGSPLDESTETGDPGEVEPPVLTRVHSVDFSSDFN